LVLEHKYLFATLFSTVPLTVALLFARRLRNTAIVCGVILSFYSPPVAWLYERVYWAPVRVFGGDWGVEDVIFCFHAGVLSWLCALGPWGNKIQISPVATVAFRRLLLLTLFAGIVLTCLRGCGFTVLLAFLIAQTISSAILLMMRPSYVLLVVSGVPLFMTYYFVLLGLWRLLIPGFMDMWTGTELTGRQFLGVPMEEYLWVVSFCTGFPITMAFAFDVRLGTQKSAVMKSGLP
jgi:hypothetical protein